MAKQLDLVSRKFEPHAHGTYLSHPDLSGFGFIYFIPFSIYYVTHNQMYTLVAHVTPIGIHEWPVKLYKHLVSYIQTLVSI